MREIVFATNNEHKLQELREIVGHKFNILSLVQIGCHDDIPETASTIEGNAEMKARYVKQHYGYDCFSDDTGLEIDALGGEPGVYSARYAGPGHDSEANIDKVLAKLQGVCTSLRVRSRATSSPSGTARAALATTASLLPSRAGASPLPKCSRRRKMQ